MNIKFPEDKTKVLEGQYPAQQIAESLAVAYWLQDRDDGAAFYHLKAAHENMRKLADALGYTLTPKDQ
jgi:hypothetical protein